MSILSTLTPGSQDTTVSAISPSPLTQATGSWETYRVDPLNPCTGEPGDYIVNPLSIPSTQMMGSRETTESILSTLMPGS